jgi:hypothetical protein
MLPCRSTSAEPLSSVSPGITLNPQGFAGLNNYDIDTADLIHMSTSSRRIAQFSRLQLAAALVGRYIFRLLRISLPPSSSTHFVPPLVEYDNDLDDPSKPLRSAQDSAIFAFLRHAKDPRKVVMAYQEPSRNRNSVDYLGVPLPGDTTGIEDTGRASRMGGNAPSVPARRSLDHLRTPSQDLERLNQSMKMTMMSTTT